MQKYQPRLHIVDVTPHSQYHQHPPPQLNFVQAFPETQFIAVTAYQNTDVSRNRIGRFIKQYHNDTYP